MTYVGSHSVWIVGVDVDFPSEFGPIIKIHTSGTLPPMAVVPVTGSNQSNKRLIPFKTD